MTINKTQGQSFSKAGIYLPQPVFSHGQLYVALSRVGEVGKVYMLILDENGSPVQYTNNIVYKSVL